MKIKERVEINPRGTVQRNPSESATPTPALKFEFYWKSPNGATITVTGPCGINQNNSGGGDVNNYSHLEVVVSPAWSGWYSFLIDLSRWGLCGESYWVYDENGNLLAWDQTGLGSCWIDHGPFNIDYEYTTGFYISASNDTLQSGGGLFLGQHFLEECLKPKWSSSGKFTIEIVGGNERGQFYTYGSDEYVPLGNIVNSDCTFWFMANDFIPKPGGTVAFVMTDGDMTATKSIFIKPTPLDHFDVTVSKDMIKHGENVHVSVTAKDKDDNTFDLADDVQIKLTAAPTGYGELKYNIPGKILSAPTDSLKQMVPLQKGNAFFGKNAKAVKNVEQQTISQKRKLSFKDKSIMSLQKSIKNNEEQFITDYWSAQNYVYYSANGTEPQTSQTITFTATCVLDPSITGTGQVVIGKPELVVLPIEGDFEQKIEETDLPKMPKPVIKAQLKNFNNGEVDFHWKLTIKWKAKEIDFTTPQDKTEKYESDASGQNSEIVDLEIGDYLYGETDMRGGDIITLTVTAKTLSDGKIYTTDPADLNNPFIIKGTNPDRPTLLAELGGDEYAAIAWNESSFRQFDPDGYPLQGEKTPIDFGIMGISKPWLYPNEWYNNHNDYDCDDIVWNWVTNVQQGKLYYRYCYDNDATNYHLDYSDPSGTAKSTPLSDAGGKDQLFLEAYCEYNGGSGQWYWDWVPPDLISDLPGYWVRSDDATARKQHITGSLRSRNYAKTVDDCRNNRCWLTP